MLKKLLYCPRHSVLFAMVHISAYAFFPCDGTDLAEMLSLSLSLSQSKLSGHCIQHLLQ